MKIKFIVNPISGNGKQKDIESLINKYLDKEKFDFDISITERSLHAAEICKTAIDNKYEAIIAVGGDGTINEICGELIGTDIALGIIPAGSGNGLAFHFGINRKIAESIKQLNTSQIEIVDSCTANGIPFVNVSGIGFDAHIANLFHHLTKRGFRNYIKLIFKEINYKPKKYIIKYDGKTREVKALLISFANATQYGNNFRISPKSEIDDGLIDFVIVRNMPKIKIPQFLLKIARGKVNSSEYVEIIQTKEMEIISDERIIHLDGEPHEINNNVIVKNNPKSLKVLIPNG